MPARGRDLERALGDFLSFDLRQVGAAGRRFGFNRRGRGDQARALEMGKQRQQVGRGNDVELARPARLAALRRGADQPLVLRGSMERGEQDAGRRGDAAVEAELANRDIMGQRLGVGRADRRKQAKRDRKVVMRADGTSFSVSIRELSYEGCRIQSRVALFPGVRFKMSVVGFRGVIDAVVRWSKEGVAGIEFCQELPERKKVPRAHDRLKVEGAVSLRRVGRKQYQTRLLDVTPNGCKVEFVERPRAGELLWVKLEGLDTVEAAVRWVDGFFGGIEFVRPIHGAVFDSLVVRLNA
jgi:hypothetical protein